MARWVRFEHDGRIGIGTIDGESISEHEGTDYFCQPAATGRVLPASSVRLLAPLQPRSVLALWNNFHERAKKEGQAIPAFPLYFMKPTSSVIGPGAGIRRPRAHDGKECRVIFEAELGVVIGRECHEVSAAAAADYVFGYTCVNDVTAPEVLVRDKSFKQWSRSKGYDTFTPIGPAIATQLDLQDLRVGAVLDGEVCQDYPVGDMIFSPLEVVSMLSQVQTLHPGDVISCGTSLGVRAMTPGSRIDVTIPGIGTLSNTFEEAMLAKL